LPFNGVEYLKELLLKKKVNPLCITHVNESIRKIKIAGNILVNDACPCGSGRKFEECCFGRSFFEKKHVEIITSRHISISQDAFFACHKQNNLGDL